MADLERLLADPELGSEAMDLIRSMITGITVMPRMGAEGVDLEFKGDLVRILHLCATSDLKQDAQAMVGSGRVGMPVYEASLVEGDLKPPTVSTVYNRQPRNMWDYVPRPSDEAKRSHC